MKRVFPLFVFFTILFSGCSFTSSKGFLIGIDPSFSPAVLGGQADNVYGFYSRPSSSDIKGNKVNLRYTQTGSESLFFRLTIRQLSRRFIHAISSNYETETYEASNLYFSTGPVLVVPYSSNRTRLNQFDSKILGVIANSDAFYIVQQYPHTVISTF